MELKNFLSFQSVTVNFNVPGYTMIKGQNLNSADMSLSNGSGKSALFDGIFWILQGETIRGSKDIINKYLDGGCYGILTFLVNDVEYKVLRSKDDDKYKSTLKIWKDNQDISGKGLRDTEIILMNEFPSLTSELLGSIIIFGQSLPHRFSNNTPSGRKEILERLSNTDFMIQDLKTRATNRKTELDKTIRELEDELLQFKTRRQVTEESLDSIIEQLRLVSAEEDLNNTVSTLEIELKEIDSELEQLKAEYSQKQKDLKIYGDQITEINNNRGIEKSCIENQYTESIQELKLKLNTLQVQKSTLVQEKKKLDSITDICPTCKQKIPGVIKIDTSDIKEKINELQSQITGIEIELENKRNQQIEVLESIDRKYTKLVVPLQDKINKISLESFDSHIQRLNNNKLIKTKKLAELNTLLTQKSDLETQCESLKVSVEVIDNKILYINNELEEQNHSREALQALNSILSKEFRGYLLQHVIEYIQQRCNFYSQIVYNTQLISFCLDGNKIRIAYDNKEYELLSGGERQKIDLIVQFSLRDMLCKYLNFSCNILVLDEILDNLDDTGSTQILNLISTCLSDVESVFLISHRQDFIIPYDNEITVVKGENKISTLL